MALLTDDWGYPVASSELDPNNPTVNTASECMFQMATVAYHTLNSTQTVVLTEGAEYNGEAFPAGEYKFAVDGRYWADFDQQHPIEVPARAQAWTGVAHALIGQLGVGTVTGLGADARPGTGRQGTSFPVHLTRPAEPPRIPRRPRWPWLSQAGWHGSLGPSGPRRRLATDVEWIPRLTQD